jgi:hypothetical protein
MNASQFGRVVSKALNAKIAGTPWSEQDTQKAIAQVNQGQYWLSTTYQPMQIGQPPQKPFTLELSAMGGIKDDDEGMMGDPSQMGGDPAQSGAPPAPPPGQKAANDQSQTALIALIDEMTHAQGLPEGSPEREEAEERADELWAMIRGGDDENEGGDEATAELKAAMSTIPPTAMFVHLMDSGSWERYEGARGGKGWRNTQTQRIVYTQSDRPPGSARRERQASGDRARSISERVLAHYNTPDEEAAPTEEELQELGSHLPKLTVDQLRNTRNRLLAAVGGGKRREQMVEALRMHVADLVASRKEGKLFPGQGGDAPPVEPKPRKPRAQAGQVAPQEEAWPPKPGTVKKMKVDDLLVDPERFQFKMNTNKDGVTDEFLGESKFDEELGGILSVWHDPKDGKIYVVNGHHRYELAKRTGQGELAVRFINAKTAEEARAKGAMINIAESKGTPIDAAKFMRDMNLTPEDLKARGISLKGALARDASHLVGLTDPLFSKVARGQMDQDKAIAIGKHLPGKDDLQLQLYNFIAKTEDKTGREWTPKVIAEAAKEIANSRTYTEDSGDLFGSSNEISLLEERSALKAYVQAALTTQRRDFELVGSKRRAENVAGAGNQLNVDENKRIAAQHATAAELYERAVNSKGPINDTIQEHAELLRNAKSKAARDRVQDQLVERLNGILAGGPKAVFPDGDPGTAGTANAEGNGMAGSGTPGAQEPGLYSQPDAGTGTDAAAAAEVAPANAEANSVGTSATADGKQVSFIPHPDAAPDDQTVMVNTRSLMDEWSKSPAAVTGDESPSAVKGKRSQFAEFLDSGKPVQAMRGAVGADGKIDLSDGRHRLSVLADRGADQVAITVPKDQAEAVVKRYAGDADASPATPRKVSPSHIDAYKKAKEKIGQPGQSVGGVRMKQDVTFAVAKSLGVSEQEAESILEDQSSAKLPAEASMESIEADARKSSDPWSKSGADRINSLRGMVDSGRINPEGVAEAVANYGHERHLETPVGKAVHDMATDLIGKMTDEQKTKLADAYRSGWKQSEVPPPSIRDVMKSVEPASHKKIKAEMSDSIDKLPLDDEQKKAFKDRIAGIAADNETDLTDKTWEVLQEAKKAGKKGNAPETPNSSTKDRRLSVGDQLKYTGRGADPTQEVEFRGYHQDPTTGKKMVRVIFRPKSGPPFETSVDANEVSHADPKQANIANASQTVQPKQTSSDWRSELKGKKRWEAVETLRTRDPHELTADEYVNYKTFDHEDIGRTDPTFMARMTHGSGHERQVRQQYENHLLNQHAEARDKAFIAGKEVAQKPDWAKKQADYMNDSGNDDVDHRAAVESALAAGKPVPAEVLADYPDLAPKAKADPAPESPEPWAADVKKAQSFQSFDEADAKRILEYADTMPEPAARELAKAMGMDSAPNKMTESMVRDAIKTTARAQGSGATQGGDGKLFGSRDDQNTNLFADAQGDAGNVSEEVSTTGRIPRGKEAEQVMRGIATMSDSDLRSYARTIGVDPAGKSSIDLGEAVRNKIQEKQPKEEGKKPEATASSAVDPKAIAKQIVDEKGNMWNKLKEMGIPVSSPEHAKLRGEISKHMAEIKEEQDKKNVSPERAKAMERAKRNQEAESKQPAVNDSNVTRPMARDNIKLSFKNHDGQQEEVEAQTYAVPNYNGPKLAVSQYKKKNGYGYRVHFADTGEVVNENFIGKKRTVGPGTLDELIDKAVQGINYRAKSNNVDVKDVAGLRSNQEETTPSVADRIAPPIAPEESAQNVTGAGDWWKGLSADQRREMIANTPRPFNRIKGAAYDAVKNNPTDDAMGHELQASIIRDAFAKHGPKPEAVQEQEASLAKPKNGDRNDKGEVYRDGEWLAPLQPGQRMIDVPGTKKKPSELSKAKSEAAKRIEAEDDALRNAAASGTNASAFINAELAQGKGGKMPHQKTLAEVAEANGTTPQKMRAAQNGRDYELLRDHQRSVSLAVRHGLAVPAEVLADYPDLSPNAPTSINAPTAPEDTQAATTEQTAAPNAKEVQAATKKILKEADLSGRPITYQEAKQQAEQQVAEKAATPATAPEASGQEADPIGDTHHKKLASLKFDIEQQNQSIAALNKRRDSLIHERSLGTSNSLENAIVDMDKRIEKAQRSLGKMTKEHDQLDARIQGKPIEPAKRGRKPKNQPAPAQEHAAQPNQPETIPDAPRLKIKPKGQAVKQYQVDPSAAKSYAETGSAAAFRIQDMKHNLPIESKNDWNADDAKTMGGVSGFNNMENAIADMIFGDDAAGSGDNYTKLVKVPGIVVLHGNPLDAPGAEVVVPSPKVAAVFTHDDVKQAFRSAIMDELKSNGDENMPIEEIVDNYQWDRREKGELLEKVASILQAKAGRSKAEAGQAENQPAAPQPPTEPANTPSYMEASVSDNNGTKKLSWPHYGEISKKLRNGEMTAKELHAHVDELMANREAIESKLADQYRKMRYHKNADSMAHETFLALISKLNEPSGRAVSYTMDVFGVRDKAKTMETKLNAYRDHIHSITDEELQGHAAEVKRKAESLKKSIENPQTLREFMTFLTHKKESDMTPDQKAKYDDLVASERRKNDAESRAKRAVVASPVVGASGLGHTITEGWHTKHNRPLHVVSLKERVDSGKFKELAEAARKLRGNYQTNTKWTNGKTPDGFNFDSKEDAERFSKLLSGEQVSREEDWNDNEEESIQKTSGRLMELADRSEQSADESLGRERLVNTHRRAGMAASAEQSARTAKARSATLRNVAEAIANGQSQHLRGIRHGSHIDTIDSALNQAKYAAERAADKANPNRSYAEREEQRGRVPTVEDVEHAQYPHPSFTASDLFSIARSMLAKPGAKRIGAKVQQMAEQIKERGPDNDYVRVTNPSSLEILADAARSPGAHGLNKTDVRMLKWKMDNYMRLQAADIKNVHELRAALREYVPLKTKPQGEDEIKKLERKLIGRDIPGFFPTPRPAIDEMLNRADIQDGHDVLEPSAGKGDIMDGIRDRHPGANTLGIEIDSTLRDIVKKKQHTVADDTDFLQHKGEYDRILMNPPFEKMADVDHVRHAYTLLKPGGRMVAIMSESPFFNSQNKAAEFRNWLEQVGGEAEQMEEGSFAGPDAFRQTGVRTRMVTITKPDKNAD